MLHYFPTKSNASLKARVRSHLLFSPYYRSDTRINQAITGIAEFGLEKEFRSQKPE
jgi:hypothetical protein